METEEEENAPHFLFPNGERKQKDAQRTVTLLWQQPGAPKSSDAVPPVGKTQKRKPSPSAVDDGKMKQQLLDKNKFAKLAAHSTDNDGNEVPSTSKGTKRKTTPVVSPPGSNQKVQKLPPLVVKNVNFATLLDKLDSCIAKPVYKITRFGIKLLCATIDEYQQVKEHLIKSELEFYSHDRPNDRPYRVVLRGLPSIDPKRLLECLKEQYDLTAQSVHIIRRKGECAALDEKFHLVCFEKGHTNLKKLREVTTVAQIAVRWEAYRNKRADATQCLNCLYHGHGTRNCHLKGRCNHCGEAHNTEACQKKNVPEKKCANCDGAHSATDRSCPKRAEYIRIRQQSTVANQRGRRTGIRGPPALSSVEFPPLPSTSAPAGPINTPSSQPAYNSWTNIHTTDHQNNVGNQNESSSPGATDQMPLFSAAECWAIFTEFCGRLQQCQSRKDQIGVIGQMACKYGVK